MFDVWLVLLVGMLVCWSCLPGWFACLSAHLLCMPPLSACLPDIDQAIACIQSRFSQLRSGSELMH